MKSKKNFSTYDICKKTLFYFFEDDILHGIAIIVIFMIIVIVMIMDVEIYIIRNDIFKDLSQNKIIRKSMEILFFEIICSFFQELKGFIFIWFCGKHIRKISEVVFKNIFSKDFLDDAKYDNGTTQNRIEVGIEGMTKLLSTLVLNVLPVIIQFCVLGYKFRENFKSIFCMMVLLAFTTCAIIDIVLVYFRIKYKYLANKSIGKGQKVLYEAFMNTEIIKTCGTEDHELKKYLEKMKTLQKSYVIFKRLDKTMLFVERTIFSSLKFWVFYFYVTSETTVDIRATLGILKGLVEKSEKNAMNSGKLFRKFRNHVMDSKFIMDFLEVPFRSKNLIKHFDFNDNIEFNNFSIIINENININSIDFNIKKGEKIAIIGCNGAGKSTFLKSILKLNQYGGNINIDNHNIQDLETKKYRNLFSYVPQNIFLFDETIIYNILYGTQNVTEEKVWAISNILRLDKSIATMKKGYYTKIGENGLDISGGERQKILLARALLKKSPIMILDEPTSNLDIPSEANFIEYLFNQKDLTLITTLHNSEHIKRFDKVLFIGNDEFKLYQRHEKIDDIKLKNI